MSRAIRTDAILAELQELSEALQAVSCYLSAARCRSDSGGAVTIDEQIAGRVFDQCGRANSAFHSLRAAVFGIENERTVQKHEWKAGVAEQARGLARDQAPQPSQYRPRLSKEARQAIAEIEQLRCRIWLRAFMQGQLPKIATKAELRGIAMQKMNISKASFDSAWIGAIEDTGREDWYAPLRGKRPRA